LRSPVLMPAELSLLPVLMLAELSVFDILVWPTSMLGNGPPVMA
jgi:hypothetical protein